MVFYLESMVIQGLLEYLLKPIDINELRKAVSKILSQPIDSMVEKTATQRHVDL